MKNSSFISDSVFEMSLYYTRKQNKTKELFFRCLDQDKDEEYFKKELEKIWGEETEYIEEQITIFREQLHKQHTSTKLGTIIIAGLGITKQLIDKTNKQFIDKKIREYSVRINSLLLQTDKQDYLKKLVPKYTNDTKGYYSNGKLIRNVSPRTYNSMIYNTTLTRNGWIQTLNDGEELNQKLYYIPFHIFSCPYCMSYQERIFTREECIRMLGTDNEGAEEILHPNCKCVLAFYDNDNPLREIDFAKGEEEYHIRQKVNSLTLKKSEIANDIKIQKSLGNQDSVDKLNAQRNAINKQIRKQKEKLDTREKQISVTAIKRIFR